MRQKTSGLKLLVEHWQPSALNILRDAAIRERDPAVKAVEIRLLEISRDASLGDLLKEFLGDGDPQVREAAADAIGIWRESNSSGFESRAGSQLLFDWEVNQIEMNCDPPIICAIRSPAKPQQTPVGGTQDALEQMMLTGKTAGERQAAARSLLNWPPFVYRLRYAEWGVFMADSKGNLQFVRKQLDEIPLFVQRVGNASRELEARFASPLYVFKPVIHLTAGTPMVVNLEVYIQGGRPWVAYPRIDDLVMTPRDGTTSWTERKFGSLTHANPFESMDPASIPPLTDLREGFPWTVAWHRTYHSAPYSQGRPTTQSKLAYIGGIGVLWQNIIVSPKKLEWMKPADVGTNPRFAWWKRLRDVDCSWVSSRGESERFLYYDGPTHRPASVRVGLTDGKLEISGFDAANLGLYIEITPGRVATRRIDYTDSRRPILVAGLAKSNGKPEDELIQILQSRGLTPSEAAGLVDCWKPAFFQNPGRRFLAFMTADDYDQACPMTIRPQPTDKVRVGIIWTELPP